MSLASIGMCLHYYIIRLLDTMRLPWDIKFWLSLA